MLTPQAQTNPADYLYTGSAPSAVFTLAPWTIAPPGFCTPTHSCAVLSGPVALDLCTIADGLSTGVFDASTGGYTFTSNDNMPVVVPGVYNFQITATVGSTVSTVNFDLTLVNPCPSDVTLTLEPPYFEDEQKNLGLPATMQPWDFADLVLSDAWVDCGALNVDFYLNDG